MIPAEDYKTHRNLYTRCGQGFWKIIAYCDEPTVTMQNMLTGQRETFGISGSAANDYKEIGKLPEDFDLSPKELQQFKSDLRDQIREAALASRPIHETRDRSSD